MSYVRAQGTVIVSDCPGGVPSGVGALGAYSEEPGAGELAVLEAQINRFLEPTTPAALRPSTEVGPQPVTGAYAWPFPPFLMTILSRRAHSEAYANIPAEQKKVLGEVALVLDRDYVLAHQPEIVALVQGYGDSKGLPAARPLPITSTTMNKLIVAGVALGIFIFAKGLK